MSPVKNSSPTLPTRQEIEASERLWRTDERHIMGYFWSKRNRSVRSHVPISVLRFLEAERGDGAEHRIEFILGRLASEQGLIEKASFDEAKAYQLTKSGVAHVVGRHSGLFEHWERVLELVPPSLSLLAAVVGFVASIYGLIEFGEWLAKRAGI